MMRLLFFILFGGACFAALGQPDSLPEKFTIRIRERPQVEPPTLPEELPLVELPAAGEEPDLSEPVAVLPRLYEGTYSFLRVEPYTDTPLPEDASYIVFDYRINARGRAEALRIFRSNDRRLERILAVELHNSRWHPARNAAGQALAFTFPKQVLILSGRPYEEDFDRY